jgi:hypothetical protein
MKSTVKIYSKNREVFLELEAELVYPPDFETIVVKVQPPQKVEGVNKILYIWLNDTYQFEPDNKPAEIKRFVRIEMPNEHWELEGCWPKFVNFDNLDGSEDATIELGIKFDTLTVFFNGEKTLCVMK